MADLVGGALGGKYELQGLSKEIMRYEDSRRPSGMDLQSVSNLPVLRFCKYKQMNAK